MKFYLSFLLLITFIFSKNTNAQNLVPNPSFEDYTVCPNNLDEVYFSNAWHSYGQSPDYYNSCDSNLIMGVPLNSSGYQNAYIGHAYCGIYTHYGLNRNYREFIGCQLLYPLSPNVKYYVSLQTSLAEGSNCGTNNLGFKFSTISYDSSRQAPINNNTQFMNPSVIIDTANWVQISGSFVADSSYKYVSIGNFFDDNMTDTLLLWSNGCTAYYYIDNVCVSTDSTICEIISGISESTKKPITLFPNPANEKIFLKGETHKPVSISLINLMGQTIATFQNPLQIDVSDFEEGIYFLKINYDNHSNYIKQIILH